MYINYNIDGKILGYYENIVDTDINIEVTSEQYYESQKFNKITIIDGIISFDNVDWRTPEEISEQELKAKIQEAKAYLANTDYKMLPNYVPKVDEDLDAIIAKRNETREFIRNNNA